MVDLHWRKSSPTSLVMSGLFLMAVVGCGTTATPTPRPVAPSAPPVAAPAVTMTAAPVAAAPTEQGVTRAPLGRGLGNVKEEINIKAGKTNVVVGKATLAPGGFLGWHYHDGPTLWIVLSGTITISHADGTTEEFPAGSAFFERPGKADVHRMDNKGTVDAAYLVTGLLPPEVPAMIYVPGPVDTTQRAALPNEQGVTRELLGRGSGNVNEAINIKAGKTNLVSGKTTLAPGGFLGWHYHDGPILFTVLSGTITISHADGTTEEFPAGSAFFEKPGKVDFHRMDNKGTVDAAFLVTVLLPPEVPAMIYVPRPAGR
jgi:quercetin dioxygenase-like cupin family protein